MAELAGNLWEFNFTRVIVVDVSDDYVLMQPPLPSEYYPILKEAILPRYLLSQKLPQEDLVSGYLYDWHESSDDEHGSWYVGVVNADLAASLEAHFA